MTTSSEWVVQECDEDEKVVCRAKDYKMCIVMTTSSEWVVQECDEDEKVVCRAEDYKKVVETVPHLPEAISY